MGSATVGLARACHPGPTATVTAVAALLAAATGRGSSGVVAVGAAVLAGQLSVGWSNDWFDAARDQVTGRADKPVARGALTRRAVAVAALAAAAATIALSLLAGGYAGLLHIVAVAVAWSYNWPLKATAASVAPFAVAFGLLPAFVVAGGSAAAETLTRAWWLVAAGALLGAAAHFANVLPDLDDDARSGIRGLPHRLGARGSRLTAAVLLVAATTVLAFGPPGPVAAYGVAVLAGAAAVLPLTLRYGQGRTVFRVIMVVAVADVALFLLAGRLAS